MSHTLQLQTGLFANKIHLSKVIHCFGKRGGSSVLALSLQAGSHGHWSVSSKATKAKPVMRRTSLSQLFLHVRAAACRLCRHLTLISRFVQD